MGDTEIRSEAEGNGPVDASLNAIDEIAKVTQSSCFIQWVLLPQERDREVK